jgi:hypothetical protein
VFVEADGRRHESNDNPLWQESTLLQSMTRASVSAAGTLSGMNPTPTVVAQRSEYSAGAAYWFIEDAEVKAYLACKNLVRSSIRF